MKSEHTEILRSVTSIDLMPASTFGTFFTMKRRSSCNSLFWLPTQLGTKLSKKISPHFCLLLGGGGSWRSASPARNIQLCLSAETNHYLRWKQTYVILLPCHVLYLTSSSRSLFDNCGKQAMYKTRRRECGWLRSANVYTTIRCIGFHFPQVRLLWLQRMIDDGLGSATRRSVTAGHVCGCSRA